MSNAHVKAWALLYFVCGFLVGPLLQVLQLSHACYFILILLRDIVVQLIIMKSSSLDFYKEGTTLLYVKRDIEENYFFQVFAVMVILLPCVLLIEQIKVSWIVTILKSIVFGFVLIIFVIKFFTEKNRPQNSKYLITLINSELYYERITPEKEGFNNGNKLINFDIVKFIDEKESEIKIISNIPLPWENRKIQVPKEYLPYKKEIVEFLNTNFTIGIDYSDVLSVK